MFIVGRPSWDGWASACCWYQNCRCSQWVGQDEDSSTLCSWSTSKYRTGDGTVASYNTGEGGHGYQRDNPPTTLSPETRHPATRADVFARYCTTRRVQRDRRCEPGDVSYTWQWFDGIEADAGLCLRETVTTSVSQWTEYAYTLSCEI